MKDIQLEFYVYKTYHYFQKLKNRMRTLKLNFVIKVAEIINLAVKNNHTRCLFTILLQDAETSSA